MTLPPHRFSALRPCSLALFGGVALAGLLQTTLAAAATYYVAPPPVGSDMNTGAEASPLASLAQAQTLAAPGDTVLLRGGTYSFTRGTTTCASQTAIISGLVLSKSGTADSPINYFAAPGERPILDFDGIRDSCRIKGILLSGSFIHLRGLELRGVRQNNNLNHESWGVWIQGSDNVLEALDVHDIMGAGVFIQRGSNNLVLNCDSHDNLDELTSNGAGESADGFGCHVSAGETGNVFRGCRAWWNADDGYDFINAFAACTVESSWAWYNGYRPGTLTAIGNGNGFKAGGYGADPAAFPNNPPQHAVRQSLSVLNRAAGFYANHHPVSAFFTNNTGYGNRPNFNMLGMDANGGDITVGVYRNNLAVGGTLFSNRNAANDANNSWSLGGVTVSDADFQGVSQIGLDAPRQADGSLPVLANFHLAAGSDVIDRGVDVQLPFAGAAPDLGAFESGLVVPPPVVPPTPGEQPADPAPVGGGTPPPSPTFGVGSLPGDTGSGSGATGATGSATPGASGPASATDAPAPLDGSSGEGAIGSGSDTDPSASDGCACTAAGGSSTGVSPSLTGVVLVLFGLRRRGAGRRVSSRLRAVLLISGAVLGCSDVAPEPAGPAPFSEPPGSSTPGATSNPGSVATTPPAGAPVMTGNATNPPGPSGAGNVAGSGGSPSDMPAQPEAPPAPVLNPSGPTPSGTGSDLSAGGGGTQNAGVGGAPSSGGMPPAPGGKFGLGGASRCAGGAFAVCESFEAAALGASAPAGWSFAGYGNRTLRVVDDDSARGDRALRVDVDANQGAVVGMLSRGAGALGQRHFGRSFLKIQSPPPTGFVHFDAFEARGNFNGQANLVRWASTGTDVGTGSGNWSWIYNVQSTDHGEFGSEGPRSAHPRAGDWMCLEWSLDAAAQEARFWFDAVEVDYLHIDTERSEIPVFDTLNIGFQKFQQTGAWTVWVDEVAFDDQRIGCDG